MIFPLAGMLFGAIVGAWRAKSRGGNRLDMLQWAAAFATIFALIGLFALIFVERSYF
jgi:heme A synthase